MLLWDEDDIWTVVFYSVIYNSVELPMFIESEISVTFTSFGNYLSLRIWNICTLLDWDFHTICIWIFNVVITYINYENLIYLLPQYLIYLLSIQYSCLLFPFLEHLLNLIYIKGQCQEIFRPVFSVFCQKRVLLDFSCSRRYSRKRVSA